ncbi:MAG TPA: hypothetical protein PLX97_07675 [Gemmatales bacterium]|nr:hypothetical protein [Gemmatales bacterium]
MSMILFAIFSWFLVIVVISGWHARTLRALWREPMLARPVVIVESDDWGPGPESDATMLRRIAGLLGEIRDADGHPAVMTLGVVLGRPDGAAILADDCLCYHRRSLDEACYSAIVCEMQMGCDAGVFAFQRHGLEHCWPPSLLARAREDHALRGWLANPDARSEMLPSELQSRWVDAAILPSRALPETQVDATVKEEAIGFRRLFGEAPTVAVPNTFVWNEVVERAWAASGVRYVVTCGRQYEGRRADGRLMLSKRQILNIEPGAHGVHYVVRDVYFEPIRGHRAEQVWEAVAQRARLGRPALIETHRENFIVSPELAERALSELARALRGVCSRHPDAQFCNTATLADEMSKVDSSLFVKGASDRICLVVRRLLATPALSRSMKLSGQYLLLLLIERALGRVARLASNGLVDARFKGLPESHHAKPIPGSD